MMHGRKNIKFIIKFRTVELSLVLPVRKVVTGIEQKCV